MSKAAIRTLVGMVRKDAITALETQVGSDPANGGKILIYANGSSHLYYQGTDHQKHYNRLMLLLDWYDESSS